MLNGENADNVRKKQELLARLRSSMSGVVDSLGPMAADFANDTEHKADGGDCASAVSSVKEEATETS